MRGRDVAALIYDFTTVPEYTIVTKDGTHQRVTFAKGWSISRSITIALATWPEAEFTLTPAAQEHTDDPT